MLGSGRRGQFCTRFPRLLRWFGTEGSEACAPKPWRRRVQILSPQPHFTPETLAILDRRGRLWLVEIGCDRRGKTLLEGCWPYIPAPSEGKNFAGAFLQAPPRVSGWWGA